MKPYSKDLRIRVPTVKRWLRRRRETGGVEARPIPGRPRVKGAALGGWLPGHLENNDDLTLEEHREAFEEESGAATRP
ncbi:MAG: hypothetical protein ACRDTR_09665 [Rubrobacter sp.]